MCVDLKRFAGRPSLFHRLKRLLSPAPVDGGSVVHAQHPMMFTECVGRPYLIGPGTFLVATYLQSYLHDLD